VKSNWKPLIVYGGGPRFFDVIRTEGSDADAKNNHKWGRCAANAASVSLPAGAQLGLPAPTGVVEQTHIGAAHPAIQLRGKAVRRNVDHAMPARHLPRRDARPACDGAGNTVRRSAPGSRPARRGSPPKTVWVADRTIEIDKQAADGRSHQRGPTGTGECLGHDQRPGIVAAVAKQRRPSFPKQPPIGRGYAVTAVFTADDEGIHPADHVTTAARASGETPFAYLRAIRR
jgi:hypothetical protein